MQLAEFLDQLVDMFRLQAIAKGIEFATSAPDVCPAVVYTDEKRLRQILINLLSNAIKFTDTGHVTFRVRYRSRSPNSRSRTPASAFTRRSRAHLRAVRARAHGGAKATTGTGLGLTITRLLTEIMGGDITVRSEVGRRQHVPRQADAVGSVAPAHRLDDGIPRARL